MINPPVIKSMRPSEYPFLRKMFYTSLFVPPGESPFPRSILEKPGLAKYLTNWGRPNDICFIAYIEEEPIGAIWSRFFSRENMGYGFISENIPEVGIAVKATYRNCGVGGELITKLINEATERAYSGLSLSVDYRNSAIRLYQRFGFNIIKEEGSARTMVLYFNRDSILSQRNS